MPPHYPPPLVMPPAAAAIQVMQMREQHNEQKRLCFECENVEKALLRHAQEALEDKYIAALVDNYANLIAIDTPATLDCLFYNFRKVILEHAAQKETEVMAMVWLPSDPIILLTKPLEDLNNLAQ